MVVLTNEYNEIIAISYSDINTEAKEITKYVINNDNVPNDVINNPTKYCYSGENGFYPNPNYEEEIPPEDTSVDYDEIALDHEFRISILELGI